MKCTWLDCIAEAKHPQLDINKRPWAYLCDTHNTEIDRNIDTLNVKGILSSWVKASGGAKALAAKM